MGRSLFLFLMGLLSAGTAWTNEPIPVFWHLPSAQQSLLGITPSADPRVQLWLECQPEGSFALSHSDSEPVWSLGSEKIPASVAAELRRLCDDFDAQSSHWSLTLGKTSYQAIVAHWNLVADLRLHSSGPVIQLRGLQPHFFVPELGEVEIFRPVRPRSLKRKRLSLNRPLEYLIHHPPTAAQLQAHSEPLIPTGLGEDSLWAHEAIVLTGTETLKAQLGTLWQANDTPRALTLSYADSEGPREAQLSAARMREVVAALKAHQTFQPLVFSTAMPLPASSQLETVVVDLRQGPHLAKFHFLMRHRSGGGPRFDVVPAESISPRPAMGLPLPIIGPPPRLELVAKLVERFLEWGGRSNGQNYADAFERFLREQPANLFLGADEITRYSETLVATERLISNHELALRQTPLSHDAFQQLLLSEQARQRYPGVRLLAFYASLHGDLRFRPSRFLGQTPLVYFLDKPLSDFYPLFEILAQSSSGQGVLRVIAPLKRTGKLVLRLTEDPNAPPVEVRREKLLNVIYLRAGQTLGRLIEPFIFELVLGVKLGLIHSPEMQAETGWPSTLSQLEILQAANATTRKILSDLSHLSADVTTAVPNLAEHLLATRPGVQFDIVAREQTIRSDLLCHVVLSIMGEREGQSLSGLTSPGSQSLEEPSAQNAP